MLVQSLHSDIVPHCRPAHGSLLWISLIFSICVPSYLALASLLLGTCSIISNLVASLPQIVTNYNRGEVVASPPPFWPSGFWGTS